MLFQTICLLVTPKVENLRFKVLIQYRIGAIFTLEYLMKSANSLILFIILTLTMLSCGGSTSVTQNPTPTNNDTISPIITLVGKQDATVTLGKKYNELGATANDNIDGNIKVDITGEVSTSQLGTYKLKYSAIDSAGNRATVYRIVVVEAWYNDLHPYQQSSDSAVLKKCVKATAAFSCTLLELPFIGQKTKTPSEKDILNRVIVSHNWMGDRFKKILAKLPDDIKLLLRSVTAIVIDDDIRPSFYTINTGAIYLDPASFWLTNSEKDDIGKETDFRSSFGNDLSFLEFWVYTKNYQRAYGTNKGTLYNTIERTLDDITLPLAHLLYHELAHANDFAPFDDIQGFDKTDNIYNTLFRHLDNGHVLAKKLNQDTPLNSATLASLAKVRFRGETATAEQKQLAADYIGALFSADGAVVHYSYNSIYEDVANLFATAMMKYHYNINIDHAFIYPTNMTPAKCSDYIVGWGTRNRMANPLVINRTKYVVEHILPQNNWQHFFQFNIGIETPKVAGKDWCQNLAKPNQLRRQSDQNIALRNLIYSPHTSASRIK